MKNFKLKDEDIQQLIDPMGGCMAMDTITVEGAVVGFMYRDESSFEEDSGWRFLAGTESQEYADNPDHWGIYDANTLANYDAAIIPYLQLPTGTELERIKGTEEFRLVNNA